MNFLLPFARELLLARGFISADRHAISTFLGKKKNRAVGLVVGGAAESLHSYPGKNSLILKKRKGFIKLALRNGYTFSYTLVSELIDRAKLVPVYSFGETGLLSQVRHPIMLSFQRKVYKLLSFAPCVFYGRFFLPIPFANKRVTTVSMFFLVVL